MTGAGHGRESRGGGRPPPLAPGAWLGLGLLTVAMALSYADRFLLASLVEPLKAELHLSDTMLGLLTGLAFSIVYALVAVPIAQIADRGSRKAVLMVALLAWSAATALCGAVRSAGQLAAARFLVGGAEAGGVPASHAMIADLFPPDRRSTALAIFSMGGSLGMMIAYAGGEWLAAHVGWRMTFVVVGAVGLAWAAVVAAWFREPARGRHEEAAAPSVPPSGSAVLDLWRNRAYRPLFFAAGFSVFVMYAQGQWLPAFFQRSFGEGVQSFGGLLAAANGGGSLVGSLIGGLLADRLSHANPAWPMRIVLWSTLLAGIAQVWMFLSPTIGLASAMSLVSGLAGSLYYGPIMATVQSVVRPERRATATAMTIVSSATLGMGGGPILTGALSDLYSGHFGRDGLRYALLTITLVATPIVLACYGEAIRQINRRAALAPTAAIAT